MYVYMNTYISLSLSLSLYVDPRGARAQDPRRGRPSVIHRSGLFNSVPSKSRAQNRLLINK